MFSDAFPARTNAAILLMLIVQRQAALAQNPLLYDVLLIIQFVFKRLAMTLKYLAFVK